MPTPRIPTGFKPVIQGYGIGSPTGVAQTDVAAGLPRSALTHDRGIQAFQVTLILPPEKFSVWALFFHKIIKNGAYDFIMPLDSGFGLADHTCQMVAGSYSAARAQGSQVTSVSFAVLAESQAYQFSDADAAAALALWEEYDGDYDELLARIDRFANLDTLVLQ